MMPSTALREKDPESTFLVKIFLTIEDKIKYTLNMYIWKNTKVLQFNPEELTKP